MQYLVTACDNCLGNITRNCKYAGTPPVVSYTTHTYLTPSPSGEKGPQTARTLSIDPVPHGGSEDFTTELPVIEPFIGLPARERIGAVKKKGGMK